MTLFSWDRNLETGFSDVDRQHRRLVSVINQFGGLLSRSQLDPGDLEKVFAELVEYTNYHFAAEETLMDQTGVDPIHIRQHVQEHRGFLQDVTLMHRQLFSSSDETGKELFTFLMNWLVYHIMGSDKSMARQIAAIQAGQSASAAFREEEEIVDQATDLLLTSLKRLFQQVSIRNQQLLELNLNLEARVLERTRELSDANRQLGELALTDTLTGLSNRRHAMQLLERLWDESAQGLHPLACLMIDADGFKRINDTYGHAAGDFVLQELARQLAHAVRTDDVVCRLGGDEFLIICPNTNLEGALQLAGQIRTHVAGLSIPAGEGAWPGSISVGVGIRTTLMKHPEELLKVADLGVYAAKDAGRNCVKAVLSAAAVEEPAVLP